MSNKSNNNGRAYEYACLITFESEIKKQRSVEIIKNSSYEAAIDAWLQTDEHLKQTLITSAEATVTTVFNLEPLIIEQDNDILTLYIQKDEKGEEGDIRDIVISRKCIQWEIGLSVKHNHLAVKHSRIAKALDFSEKWFGSKNTEEYWYVVNPIFDKLVTEKAKGTYWRDIPNKNEDIYKPLLQAFMDEINRQCKLYKDTPKKMVEYLLGKFDFYKVISLDNKRITQLQAYNLHGTLNKPSKTQQPITLVPESTLPTRIVAMAYKPKSSNTIEIFMDNGWQFSFRIHNAEDIACPSLKFDVQIIGMPTTIITINCNWKNNV